MRSKSLRARKQSTTLRPQQQLMPLSRLSLHPSCPVLGSAHSMSDTSLLSSTSIGRLIWLSPARCLMRGLSPPCTQKMRYPTTAAMGRKLKVSAMTFHSLELSLRLHSSKKPYSLLSSLDSWLPLSRKKELGQRTLQARRRRMHSRDCLPLSTQSPRKRQFLRAGEPKMRKMVSRSWNCPCMSPQICTGASSSRSMGCSWRMLRAMEQSPSISCSLRT